MPLDAGENGNGTLQCAVFIPFACVEAAASRLTRAAADPFGKIREARASANDQHGYFRVGQYLKRLAAKQDALDAAPPVRRHHDKFRL